MQMGDSNHMSVLLDMPGKQGWRELGTMTVPHCRTPKDNACVAISSRLLRSRSVS